MNAIHPAAVIEPGAELGVGVRVGPGAVIHAGARIGDGCRIAPHVVIFERTRLGRDCRVHAHAVLGDVPQDLAFEECDSELIIGERCTLREGFTAHRGTGAGTRTVIGDDCYLMNHSHVGHNAQVGNRVIFASQVLLGGHSQVGDGAVFGGGALLHQFCRVGRLAMIGGGCGVNKDVPPFCMTRSLAIAEVIGLNVVGLRRNGIDGADRAALKQALRTLYCGSLPLRDAAADLAATTDAGPGRELAEFILASKRGVCGYAGSAEG